VSYTRTELEAQIAEQLDAVNDPRYTNTTTLIRPVLDAVTRRGWARILNANRYVRFGKRTVTTDGEGRVPLFDLDHDSGDDKERFYRVLAVAKGTIRYTPAEFMDAPLAETAAPTSLRYTFERQGNNILFLPVEAGAEMTVWVNHLPPRPSQLSAGTVAVVWPEDYELILVYEVAARMAAKGAAEQSATVWFQRLADDLWGDLLSDLARFTTDPITMGASDTAAEWGGI
jgi:hypothetical protein